MPPAGPPFEPWRFGARCAECPLYLSGKKPVAPTGPENAEIAFVGEAPAKWEEIKGKVLQGPSGAKLDEMLYKLGVHRAQVRAFNAAQCRFEIPGEMGSRRYDVNAYMAWHRKQNVMRKKQGLQETPDPFTCCKPYVDHELRQLEFYARQRGSPNGAVVIPMGNWALQACGGEGRVAGKLGGIMRFRGSVLEAKI